MNTKKIIRLGFIGCGKISEKHFSAIEEIIAKSGSLKLVAVCDIDRNRAEIAATRMNANAYNNIDEMLQNESLDLVTIATPNGLHPEHIKKVADYKIDIITDKPIATTLAQGKDALSYCNQKAVKLYVLHQVRFNDTIQLVKKAIDAKRFGRIYMITSNVFWTRPQEYYDMAPWHGTKNMDGGAYLTQASHFVDLIQWFAEDEPRMIFSKLATLARKIETEDTGSAVFEWKGGIIGNLNVTMLAFPKNYESSITILGEKGTVRIGGAGMNKIEHWEFANSESYDKEILEGNYPSFSILSAGHARYYEDVIKSIIDNDHKPLVSGEEGIKSLRLLQAIYDSNESQKAIFLES